MANITGTSGDDSRSGGNDADHMFGLAGNDTLQGFNNNDTLDGGAGNDSLIGGNGGGTGDGSDSLFGGVGNDTLDGSGNRCTLDGGTGADSMLGGQGSDLFIVDDAGDIVREVGSGDSRVQSSIAFDLNANGATVFGDIANLTLTGSAAVSGTGNALANKITGNSGANTLTGNGGDDTLDGGAGADSMIGGAGDDTYVIDNAGDKILETGVDANDTVLSKFSVDLNDLALSGIENATLTGAAAINATGNALVNHLTGNDGANKLAGGSGADTIVAGNGNDTLDGGAGIDRLIGGIGNDTYLVDDPADVVDEFNGGAGIDAVLSSASAFTLSFALENLTLLGGGIVGTGNELNNKIIGNIGANEIDGLGGADTMAGGDGNDAYFVDDKGDVVTEAAGAGRDRVNTRISFVLGANLEDLQLEDTAGDINGTGNALANKLIGNSGKNVLNGLAGDDTMTGLGGNDIYVVDSAKDVLDESVKGGGTDLVQSSIAFDLNANGTTVLGSIENLMLTGSAAIAGTGNGLDNAMTGNSGANTLTGNDGDDTLHGGAGADGLVGGIGDDTLDGGTGADTLEGGGGNDSYVIDSAADKIVESVGDLNDRVVAAISVDLNLAAFANIEHATLTGSGALNATGNAGANMLIGNAGANKLDGKGGDDTAAGGAGNDIYTVDSKKDVVIEVAGEGIDTVISSASSFTLGAFVENLTLAGNLGIGGTGNALANKITGNAGGGFLLGLAGNDTLISNGGGDVLDGGTGADSMVGGAGRDTYLVDDVGDKVVETGPASDGNRVSSTINYTLGANLAELTLGGGDLNIDGTGNGLDNFITSVGNSGNNVLSGLGGNDTMGAANGADLLLGGDGNDLLTASDGEHTLVGGAGSDTFRFDDPDGQVVADFNGLPGGDVVIAFVAPGGSPVSDFLQTVTKDGSTTIRVDSDGAASAFGFVDLVVLQGVSTDLSGLLANGSIVTFDSILQLVPIAPTALPIDGTAGNDAKNGTVLSDLIRGFAGNDSLTGNNGADTLDGGAGLDTLTGGAGNDSYVVDNAKDVIVEAVGDANDRVLAAISVDLNLAPFANIEHATLTGTAALAATGNSGANMLIGNSGANTLDGRGGNDTAAGGAGNDSYMVDSFDDVVVEFAGDGVDQVSSSAFTYQLGAFVENLTLIGPGGDGVGNALANKITGNAGGNFLLGLDGNDTLTGNDGSDVLAGGAGADSLVGGKGNDEYDVDDIGDKITESGPAGEFDKVVSSITFALGANLEGLSLSGADNIDGAGNALNNLLSGNGANNVLSGLAGNDTMEGGGGDDLLLGGDGNDTLTSDPGLDTLVGGAGSDRFAFNAAGLSGVEVIADFNGLPGGDQLDLSALIGTLTKGSESLFIQTVTAGGSTTVRVDQDGLGGKFAFLDLVVLQGVSTDFQGLLANGAIAGLATPATPAIDGTAGNDTIFGVPASDLLRGLGGNDSLVGGSVLPPGVELGSDTLDGGAGADTMAGGGGNDTYVVDNVKDVINELGSDLNDRVLASISVDLNLAPFANIEHVTLTGAAALNATGNGGANMLIGNSGANVLDGGAGNDTLIGSAGNDTYKVDSPSDVAIENPGEGIDMVISSASSFLLGAFVENLTLADKLAFNGIGNALANKITGNSNINDLEGGDGNDTLIGNDGADSLDGSAGADSLVGGTGADTYNVDNVGDKISESGPASDVDRVISTITFTLGANLENLQLSGPDAIDGTGNALNNLLRGSTASNVLSGLAGNDSLDGVGGDDLLLGGDGNDLLTASLGFDTLVGGAGSDRFAFENKGASLTGLDVIADFNGLPGGDAIDVSNVLVGFVEDSSNVNDFLRAVQANGSTTLQVDRDGAGAVTAFVDMVVLQGVSTSISGLLNNGSLVLD